MKILVIDPSSNVQQKWVEPLRSEGWGVVRVRSTEDAEKILEFHGDSLNAVMVAENYTDWAEKFKYPYVVLTHLWKELQVMKHQNSAAHAALAYLDYNSTLEQVKQALSQMKKDQNKEENKPQNGEISLEKYATQDSTVIFDTTKAEIPVQPEPILTEAISELPELIEEPVIEESYQPLAELPPVHEPVKYGNRATDNKDIETMKNYLALREQDVAILTGQVRSSQERVQQLEMQLKLERARGSELQHLVQKQEQQLQNFNRDKQVEFEVMFQQIEDLNHQLHERTEKVRAIEAKLKITTDEVEKVKERVRVDIRRIRVREKELESQLEILKKDSTALLVARDEKILELKRKIDLLEFNMELVQEQYGKERNSSEQLRHKLKEAASAMNTARGLLDQEN